MNAVSIVSVVVPFVLGIAIVAVTWRVPTVAENRSRLRLWGSVTAVPVTGSVPCFALSGGNR